MSDSNGRRRRRRRCRRRRRRGRRRRTHGCQARGDSRSCLSRRQARRFLYLHPDWSCPNRRARRRRSMSERCSCEQRCQLSCGNSGARCHRHHTLQHVFTFIRSGRRRRRRSQEQLTVRLVRIRIDLVVRTRRSRWKCGSRGSMSSCSCMRNSRRYRRQ